VRVRREAEPALLHERLRGMIGGVADQRRDAGRLDRHALCGTSRWARIASAMGLRQMLPTQTDEQSRGHDGAPRRRGASGFYRLSERVSRQRPLVSG
jgi:hypothetical protein